MSGRRFFLKSIAALAGGAAVAPKVGAELSSEMREELQASSPPPLFELEESFREAIEAHDTRLPVTVYHHSAGRSRDAVAHSGMGYVSVEAKQGHLTTYSIEFDGIVPLEITNLYFLEWESKEHRYQAARAGLMRLEIKPGEMKTRAVFTERNPLRVTSLPVKTR